MTTATIVVNSMQVPYTTDVVKVRKTGNIVGNEVIVAGQKKRYVVYDKLTGMRVHNGTYPRLSTAIEEATQHLLGKYKDYPDSIARLKLAENYKKGQEKALQNIIIDAY